MGLSTNHAAFDGISFKIFLENLASQATDHDKPLAITPCNDRHLLAARSPPRVTFPHPELLKLNTPSPPIFKCPTEEFNSKIFHLSSNDVVYLKEKAKADTNNGTTNITGFKVVTAHIWKCKALSCDDYHQNPDKLSTVLYAVNIRPRLRPPLPESYTGNAVLNAYATAQCTELEALPFGRVVEMVSEGANRMTDEYAKSVIDWGEVYKGFPQGDFLVSSWWRLGFEEVEYPWGKPMYCCPVVNHRKDIILLFPDIDGVCSNGVNVLVALPHKEMDKFQTLFTKFLA